MSEEKLPDAVAASARTVTADNETATVEKPVVANEMAEPNPPASPQIPVQTDTSPAVAIKEEQMDKDESEHIDVGNEFKMVDSEMVDVESTDRKVSIKPDLDAIIVESGKKSLFER